MGSRDCKGTCPASGTFSSGTDNPQGFTTFSDIQLLHCMDITYETFVVYRV
jgi:hypothetical protein